jgi:hypothetical protein
MKITVTTHIIKIGDLVIVLMLAFHYISAKSWWASFIKGGKQRKP